MSNVARLLATGCDVNYLTSASVSLVFMVTDDVSHCRILSHDKTEWRFISATLCG